MLVNMQKVIFRAVTMLAALAALACLARPAAAESLAGHKFLEAQGPTTYPSGSTLPDNPGFLSLTGLIEFDGKGGAKSVAITLNYNSPADTYAAVLCHLKTATDVADDVDAITGVGRLTVMISKNDTCIIPETGASEPCCNEFFYGRSITFDLYHGAGDPYHAPETASVVSTGSALLDGDTNVINIVNVTGSLVPAR